ncbi:unnamed protein product [Amaranthus hypochondriacus]
MVEYLLSILNSTELTSLIVSLLGILFIAFRKSLLECCANTFKWLITQVTEAFREWWDETKALLFSLAKETFRILLRRGLFIELERIKVKMDSLHNKLKNADSFADKYDDTFSNKGKEKAKKSVEKLVDVIYSFEGVYDRYQLLQGQEAPNYIRNSWCCWVFILKMLWVLKLNLLNPIRKISIAFSVAKLNHELVELENGDSYQPEVADESRQQHQSPPRPAPDYDLVGLQSNTEKLIKMLKERNKRQCIVVTGEAGVGKTTLVEKVYVDSEVTSYFELRAFVTVSQTYEQSDVFKAIFDQLEVDDNPRIKKIEDKIKFYLETSKKSYIVVLDDVWGDDEKFSECIKNAFPYSEKGSGILMTRRGLKSNVPGQWKEKLGAITFHVDPLPDADAKILFCKMAFPSDNGECPPALRDLLQKILLKCENNPLLIGVVAGILLNCEDNTALSWQTVIDDLGYAFRKDTAYERIKSILLYSYHDLSYELQQCFLYFGIFPKDSKIYFHTLVHIWVAEGFIKPTGTNHTLEEIAENHLNALIRRGLVILGYKEIPSFYTIVSEMREKFVRVHDVFHEIILQKLEDLEFCQVLPKASSSEILNKPFHRLSMNNTGTFLNWDKSILGNSWIVRSVLSFKNETFPNFPKTSIIYLLRVLLLDHYQKGDFPEVVSSMCNLRFLSLTHHNIKNIPVSICKLLNLETLEIKHLSTRFCKLPKEMSMLKKLRHLLLSLEVQIPEGVLRSLTALQTLDRIKGNCEYMLEELKHLTQLRRLAIVNVNMRYEKPFSKALQAMPELRFLTTSWLAEGFWRDTDSISGWIKKVTELRSLSLDLTSKMVSDKRYELIEDLIAALKPLKKLKYLYLKTESMHHFDFGSDGFVGLQYLKIRDYHLRSIKGSLRGLLELNLELRFTGSMPNLPDHLRKIAVISDASYY